MKKDIHPQNYRPVIFLDNASGEKFLIPSAVETKEKGKWEDGKEYPLYAVEISSASHPFYTGTEKVIDTAGRVEKFKKRSAAATSAAKAMEVKRDLADGQKTAGAKRSAKKGK